MRYQNWGQRVEKKFILNFFVANQIDLSTKKWQVAKKNFYSLLFFFACLAFLERQMVTAVSELIVAQILYLNKKDRKAPIYFYVNTSGTARADGETVLFTFYLQLSVQSHTCSRGCSGNLSNRLPWSLKDSPSTMHSWWQKILWVVLHCSLHPCML